MGWWVGLVGLDKWVGWSPNFQILMSCSGSCTWIILLVSSWKYVVRNKSSQWCPDRKSFEFRTKAWEGLNKVTSWSVVIKDCFATLAPFRILKLETKTKKQSLTEIPPIPSSHQLYFFSLFNTPRSRGCKFAPDARKLWDDSTAASMELFIWFIWGLQSCKLWLQATCFLVVWQYLCLQM